MFFCPNSTQQSQLRSGPGWRRIAPAEQRSNDKTNELRMTRAKRIPGRVPLQASLISTGVSDRFCGRLSAALVNGKPKFVPFSDDVCMHQDHRARRRGTCRASRSTSASGIPSASMREQSSLPWSFEFLEISSEMSRFSPFALHPNNSKQRSSWLLTLFSFSVGRSLLSAS